MAEREDTGYKVTDRRKYNPDGTPRENPEPEPESRASDDSVRVLAQAEEPAASNVLSFPGETKRQAEPPPPEVDEPQPEAEEATPPARNAEAQAAAQAAAATQAEQAYSQARGPANPQLAEASFLGLANMLGVEAAMHLGVIRPPGDEAPPVDLESARHLIDMLGILQSKTSGNLTPEEDRFLDGVLADLRMSFVEISRGR
ncbi:MAG TPA: DUF1844 domain-containing protein [Blastocatellia bacterium]|nr:DUF1844 domain-containing protein [Blastocatellia bacterium]